MKRAFVYFLIAIFLLLVVQPNIQTSDVDKNNRVPTNTTNSITTNENADIPQKLRFVLTLQMEERTQVMLLMKILVKKISTLP